MDVDGCLPNVERNTNVTLHSEMDEPSMLSIPSPLQSLQSLPYLDPNYVENFFKNHGNENYVNNETGQSLDVCQIKEFSQAIDSYFASTNDTNETDPLSLQTSSSTIQSSSRVSCFKTCCNKSCKPSCDLCFNLPSNPSSSSTRVNHFSTFNPDYSHVRITCPKFKSTLILTDDVSKVKEPWTYQVAKQILSAYYSPLSLKSEFISNQIMLDAFESVAIQEVAQAFKTIAFNNPHGDMDLIQSNFFSDPTPHELVSACEEIRAYRKLSTDDKVTLLISVLFDINTLKSVITYDPVIDGWFYGGKIWSRKWFYEVNSSQVRRLDHIIESFPNTLRNDLNAVALLYSIVLFNPDLLKLKFRSVVRQERYTYIYLLKRYLHTHFNTYCEASENLYHLMVKIDEATKLRKGTTQFFDSYQSGCSTILKNRVAHLVQFKKL